MIPVIIPAKNEQLFLESTVTSLKATARFAHEELFIVVVDDGSTDLTQSIAIELGCRVVQLPDRGYSALGLPALADTHNAGFDYIDRHILVEDYKYLMVVGADTTFDNNYMQEIVETMEKDDEIVMCAGILNNIRTNHDAVRGSGRIIRNSFWSLIGRKLPNQFHSWESYPIVFANATGFKARTNYLAHMQTPRAPLAQVDWARYGIAMKEKGSIFIYVLLRGLQRLILDRDIRGAWRLLYGFVSSSPELYESRLRKFTAKQQWNKIIRFKR